jgi:hypothetical protein
MPTQSPQRTHQHSKWDRKFTKLNVGSKVGFYDLAGNFITGKVTCFYPEKGYVDVRSSKGHTYRWRCS